MKKLWFIISVLILLLGCKKTCEDCIAIEGKVTDYVTGNPIPNADISFTFIANNCFFCSDKVLAKTKTNNNGVYKITISKYDLRIGNIEEKVTGNGYLNGQYITNSNINNLDINTKTHNKTFRLYPEVQIAIKPNRTSQSNVNLHSVHIKYVNQLYYIAQQNISPGVYYRDSTYLLKTASNVYTKIYWTTRTGNSNGQLNNYQDSLLCLQNQANVYTINY